MKTKITKPAGVGMQLLSIPVGFFGVGLLGTDFMVVGMSLIVCAGWLLYQGGRPARPSPGRTHDADQG